jgi:hypothetical protein
MEGMRGWIVWEWRKMSAVWSTRIAAVSAAAARGATAAASRRGSMGVNSRHSPHPTGGYVYCWPVGGNYIQAYIVYKLNNYVI